MTDDQAAVARAYVEDVNLNRPGHGLPPPLVTAFDSYETWRAMINAA
jgi:hypothetical protein